jgi:hypothetical protein
MGGGLFVVAYCINNVTSFVYRIAVHSRPDRAIDLYIRPINLV